MHNKLGQIQTKVTNNSYDQIIFFLKDWSIYLYIYTLVKSNCIDDVLMGIKFIINFIFYII
jgi:hypothetical protein